MNELRSKCCGTEVIVPYLINPNKIPLVYDPNDYRWECSKCHKPTEVEKKEEGGK